MVGVTGLYVAAWLYLPAWRALRAEYLESLG
jgi:hypothetical protein